LPLPVLNLKITNFLPIYFLNCYNERNSEVKTMSVFLDVLTVAVFIVVIYRAYKKGLIRTLVELVGFIAACVAAFLLSNPVGQWINKAFISRFVSGSITQFAKSGSESNTAFFTKLVDSLPVTVNKSLSGINTSLGTLGEKAMTQVINAVSVPLSSLISRCIAFFILLIICLVAIKIIANLSDIVKHMPIIGALNAIGGAAIGIAEAVLVMFLLSTLLSIAVSLMALQKNPPISTSTINSTYVYKYVYNVNPLTSMLLKT